MRFLDYVAVGVLVVLGLSWCTPARSAESEPDELAYYGTTPDGWRIYTYCINGQLLLHAEKPGAPLALAGIPHIKEAGLGIDLPTCKGGKPKARP